MRSEFPGLLYCAGALIAVTSWTLFMFSKKASGRPNSIHPAAVRHLDTVPREFGAGSRIVSGF